MAKKRGRPRLQGDRYPSGKLKPVKESDKIAPTLLHRMCEQVERDANNPELGTALGRLRLEKKLTSAQAAAGFKLAEVHGRVGYYIEVSRTPKSPKYEAGYRSSLTAADAADSDEASVDAERNAFAAFRALPTQKQHLCGQEAIQRGIAERVCVENEMPASHQLPDLRICLDVLAEHFGIVKAGKPKKSQPATKFRDNPKSNVRIISRERDSWIKVIQQLRPDLDRKRSMEAFDIYKGLVAHAEFREHKPIRLYSATNSYAG